MSLIPRHITWRSALVATLAGLLALPGPAAPNGATIEQQRTAYKAARAAIHRGQDQVADMIAAGLTDYPLYPYLVYAGLRRRLASADAAEVADFLREYAALPIADRLRARWLGLLGRRGDWTAFRAFYDPAVADSELRCLHLQGEMAAGRNVPYGPDTRDLWLVGESQDHACDPVFDHWRSSDALDDQAYLARIRLAVRAGRYPLARYLARQLPQDQQPRVDRWIGALTRPQAVLPGWVPEAGEEDLLGEALRRLARRDPSQAERLWPRIAPRLDSDPAERLSVLREIALFHAVDYAPDAAKRLSSLPAQAMDQQILEWQVRVALAGEDWPQVLRSVTAMAPEYRGRSRWRYWRARALEELGQAGPAARAFESVAAETDYYGFLAADRLGASYRLCSASAPATAPLPAEREAGVVRSLELHHVDQVIDAIREWRVALAGIEADAGTAAALRASAAGWHYQAILTLADLGAHDRYEARFPLAWPALVADAAKRFGLPPSLIYAVMRSESALRPDAVSGAGARGLMQLTPETAREVSRTLKQPAPSRRDLEDPATSLTLGSAYLRELYARYQHPLLVLAAYNAGPQAVDRWLDEDRLPQEADRWIETLPFFETRDYIPRVLAFQVLYEWRLAGRMTRLAGMMFDLDDRSGKPRWADVPRTEPVCPAAGASG